MLVDASVAFKWFVPEDGSEAAIRLLHDHELTAPEHFLAEVANALWKALLRAALDRATYDADIERLPSAVSVLLPISPLIVRSAQIAATLRHPIYDCLYLACAEQESLPLITADRRLLEVVEGTEWATLCRPLSDTA
jgi:predicted nucleic acid-binding protein